MAEQERLCPWEFMDGFFEQLISKQGLEYANNGNGRKEAATAVAFDEKRSCKKIFLQYGKI